MIFRQLRKPIESISFYQTRPACTTNSGVKKKKNSPKQRSTKLIILNKVKFKLVMFSITLLASNNKTGAIYAVNFIVCDVLPLKKLNFIHGNGPGLSRLNRTNLWMDQNISIT